VVEVEAPRVSTLPFAWRIGEGCWHHPSAHSMARPMGMLGGVIIRASTEGNV
jgi:hypothetical protein